MDQLVLVEKFQENWPLVPKYQVVCEANLSYVCFEFDGYQFYIAIRHVPHDKLEPLREEFIIFNPHKTITVDRLVAVSSTRTSDFFNFGSMRVQIHKKGHTYESLAETALLALIVTLLSRPTFFRSIVECACVQSEWHDLRTLPSWLT